MYVSGVTFWIIVQNELQRHYTENLKQIFPEMKLHGLIPNSYIHVSVSDLYVYSRDRSAYSMLQENRRTEFINQLHRYMNVEIKTEVAKFLSGDYIKRIFFAVCGHLIVG